MLLLRTTLALLLGTAGIALAQPAQPADPGPWRFVNPNAKALISIDWKRVRQSHIGTLIREKFINGSPFASAIPGIEFLDDIDRFVISSSGRNPNDENAQAPVLIMVRGHFDTARVRKVLVSHHAKPQMFNSIQVYRPQDKGSKDMAFVVLDAQTILIGDAHSVFTSLEQSALTAPPPEANSVLTRAAQMDAAYDIWAIITSPDAIASERLMDMFTGGGLSTDARGFDFGISFRNGLLADITTMFQSEAAAKQLTSELSKLLKAAIKEKVGEPAMLDIEKHLKITAEGSNAKISLRMSPQEFEKNAQIFAATHKPAALPVAGVRPVATPSATPLATPLATPPTNEKKVIKIEGLDEGPREIPYKPDGSSQR